MCLDRKICAFRVRLSKKDAPVLPLELDKYSIGECTLQDNMNIRIEHQEHDILYTDGFGFMILPQKALYTHESGFVFCSGLFLSDPLRKRSVISHLPINDQDVDLFCGRTLPRFISFLDAHKISFTRSRLSIMFGTEPYRNEQDAPGHFVASFIQRRYKVDFQYVIPLQNSSESYLFHLQTGRFTPTIPPQ